MGTDVAIFNRGGNEERLREGSGPFFRNLAPLTP
jgi:hypothetical protein